MSPPRKRSAPSKESVRALALALPEAVEGSHFAQPDFRIRKRIFATLPSAGNVMCVKATPANVDALVATDPVTFANEWHGRWLRVDLDHVSPHMLEELLVDAWALAAPKSVAKRFLDSRA